MNWLIFSLLTAVCWGFGNFFVKKGLATLTPLWSAIIGCVLYFIIYVPFALFYNTSFTISISDFFLIILIAFLYIFFYYALSKGELAISGTIIATYPIFTVTLASIFLKEELSFFQILMILLVVGGGVVLSYSPQLKTSVSRKKYLLVIAIALFASFSTGLGDFLAKVSISSISVKTYLLFFPFAYMLVVLLFSITDKKGRNLPKLKSFKQFSWTIIGVTMLNLGLLFFNQALSLGPASLVVTMSSSYIVFMILCSFLFLKEKITLFQLLGIVMIAVGVIFLGL